MDPGFSDSELSGHHYVCGCGRSFSGPGPLNFHSRTCQPTKKHFHSALAQAKEIWEKRKKPHLDSTGLGTSQVSLGLEIELGMSFII
jgi:hypothetical protein